MTLENRSAKLSESALNPTQRKFDFSSTLLSVTGIEVNFRPPKNPIITNALKEIHQIGAVIRFREYGAERTDLGDFLPSEVNSQTATTLENKKKFPR